MAQSNIDIKIIAEFLGKNAFKQADSAANKLNKTVKSLGQSFGLAFGGAALGYAVKSTIRDFADAQRETQQLTNTVKNLGLAFAAPQVDEYVQKIGALYGVTGDQAVPAMQALLTATGSVSKSTAIMNTALDLAASRNADVAAVAQDLANAYVGNTKGLKQYRLGLTNAELAALTFDEIIEKIGSQTLGAADEAAKTLSGQLAILAEVSNQAKERIGGGLFQALGGLAGPNGAGGAAKTIENLSIKLTNAITGFGYLVQEIKIAQPILVAAGIAIGLAWAPWFTAIGVAALAIGAIGNAMKKNTPQVPTNTGKLFFPGAGDGGYAERLKAEAKAEREAIARAKALAKLVKDQQKNQAKILKDKQLAAAIDKAQALLGQSEQTFDMEAIQLNAAQINQAQQLGNATSAAQLLAIANDTQRLNIKQAMLNLENAIASKDQAAITAATEKLNKELQLYGALTGQEIKLKDIATVLASLVTKDLINIENLDEAIKKLEALGTTIANPFAAITDGAAAAANAINGLSGTFSTASVASVDLTNKVAQMSFEQGIAAGNSLAASISGARYAAQAAAQMTDPFDNFTTSLDLAGNAAKYLASQVQLTGSVAAESFAAGIAAGNSLAAALSGANYAAQAAAAYAAAQAAAGNQAVAAATATTAATAATAATPTVVNINVEAGLGDPNAIAEAIEQVVQDAIDRGTLVGGVFAI